MAANQGFKPAKKNFEKEIKFELSEFSSIRAKLESLGATFLERQLESNELWDTPNLELKNSGRLLRLRVDEFSNTQTRTTLTFKNKASQVSQAYKCQEEYETLVQDLSSAQLILQGLGYRAILKYQKLREEWVLKLPNPVLANTMPAILPNALPNTLPNTLPEEKVIFALDYLPFGSFLEIEAQNPIAIAQLLALDPEKSLILSYHELNQNWLKAQNKPSDINFVFDSEHWNLLRKNLKTPLK